MSLTPSPDSGQTAIPWQAELQTTAIQFDGKAYLEPTSMALASHDQQIIEFHYPDFTEQYVKVMKE
jgi:hypothetical protein